MAALQRDKKLINAWAFMIGANSHSLVIATVFPSIMNLWRAEMVVFIFLVLNLITLPYCVIFFVFLIFG
jgi:hypothetical protein